MFFFPAPPLLEVAPIPVAVTAYGLGCGVVWVRKMGRPQVRLVYGTVPAAGKTLQPCAEEMDNIGRQKGLAFIFYFIFFIEIFK